MNTRQQISAIITFRQFLKNCILLLLISFPFMVYAATRTSTAGGGPWNSASTWVGGVAPGSNDDIIIATTGGNSVTLTAAAQCLTLTINNGAILNGGNYEIRIKGPGDPFVITGTFNPETGTIYYNNAASVNITAAIYNNLRLGGTGVKNIQDGVTVNGLFSGSGGGAYYDNRNIYCWRGLDDVSSFCVGLREGSL